MAGYEFLNLYRGWLPQGLGRRSGVPEASSGVTLRRWDTGGEYDTRQEWR
jgi:hypothetical protein